jgi:hypothetical protein
MFFNSGFIIQERMVKPAEVAEGTEDKDSGVPICRALLGVGVLNVRRSCTGYGRAVQMNRSSVPSAGLERNNG